MPYTMKPLSCDPSRIKRMSERLIISHYENNYGGAVKRLNLIDEQLAQLEFDKAAGFLINGLKREQLIAMNSMILHELFFDGLGEQSEPRGTLHEAVVRDFGSFERWRSEFVAMGKALGSGSGWVLLSWSPHDGRRHADLGTRYVRALLSHGFRRQGRGLRRLLYAGDPLAKCRASFQGAERWQFSVKIQRANTMRHFFTSLMIILFIGLSAPRLAQAQQGNSCKQCSDERRACMSGYSGKTCQTEYERCMKNCPHK
jgi:superoxide dismutase